MIQFQEDKSIGYKERTVKNASADATIAFAVDFTSAGEKLTKSSVLKQNKIYIPIDANTLDITDQLVDSIINKLNIAGQIDILTNKRCVSLNIAGNGIYTMRGKWSQEQVDNYTFEILKRVLNRFDGKIVSLRSGGQTGFDEAGAKAGVKLGLKTLILAPKGWKFRDEKGMDIMDENKFKIRFNC